MIALGAQPILLAGGIIAARKMKRNHAFTLTCYTNVVLLFTSIVGLYIVNNLDLSFIGELSIASLCLIAAAGIMTIGEQVGKFMAFRYYKAAPLQKLSFLPNVYNFLIDLAFMHVDFATIQIVSFTVLFGYYFCELIHFYFIRDHTADEKEGLEEEEAKKTSSVRSY